MPTYRHPGAWLLTAFCVLALNQAVSPQKTATAAPKRPISLQEATLRQAIYDTAATFLGKREGKINNDAAWIKTINRFSSLPDRAHYCASALYYSYAQNGVWLPVVSKGTVRAYFRDARKIIYRRGQRGNTRSGVQPHLMDFVSLYASHVEGYGYQREAFEEMESDDYIVCIGFNTTGGPGTRGGCYLNRRQKRDINAIANHLTPYLNSLK